MKQNVKTGDMRKLMTPLIGLVMVFVLIGLTSCKWSAQDYDEINSIRATALELVDKSATDSFKDHKEEVDKIDQRINSIILKKKPKIGVKMLTIIANKQRRTWGGFTQLWETQGRLSSASISSVKKNIDAAFAETLAIGKAGGVNPAAIN